MTNIAVDVLLILTDVRNMIKNINYGHHPLKLDIPQSTVVPIWGVRARWPVDFVWILKKVTSSLGTDTRRSLLWVLAQRILVNMESFPVWSCVNILRVDCNPPDIL
jgi:hypothetical protein